MNNRKYHRVIFKIIIPCLILIGMGIFLYLGSHKRLVVSTGTMYPTIKQGDYILVNIFSYLFRDPIKDEIVVLRFPKNKYIRSEKNYYFIRRIVGVPGDKINLTLQKVYVNGEQLQVKGDEVTNDNSLNVSNGFQGEIILNKDQYFTIGDNFKASLDSRYYGPIYRKEILGRCWKINPCAPPR